MHVRQYKTTFQKNVSILFVIVVLSNRIFGVKSIKFRVICIKDLLCELLHYFVFFNNSSEIKMLKSIVKRRVYRKAENEEVVTCLEREKREKWRIKGKKDRHRGRYRKTAA